MASEEESRSRRPASCWKVDVVNGAAGRRRYGLASTESTVAVRPCRPTVRASAEAWSRTNTSSRSGQPSSPKSRPDATRRPLTSTRRVVKA